VLEPSLVHEVDVAEGLAPGGFVLLNAEAAPSELNGVDVRCVPADRLARGGKFVNLVMVGALAAALDAPVDEVVGAAIDALGRKIAAAEIRAAVEEGHAWLRS